MLQLWPQIVRAHDWQYMRGYIARRATIPNCHGKEGVKADAGVRWYIPRAGDIPDFMACWACYEDVILATNFESHFQPYPQAAGEVWTCDMASPFMKRAIDQSTRSNSWGDFVISSKARLSMPACPGTNSAIASMRNWYQPKAQIPGYIMCENCYLDMVAASPTAEEFEMVQIPRARRWEQWSCDMAFLPIKSAWMESVRVKDYCLWWESTRAIISYPACAKDGITNGTWYTLRQGSENFNVCGRCYTGFVHALGCGSFFTQKYVPPGAKLLCDYNPAAARYRANVLGLCEAIETGSWAKYSDFVGRFAGVPTCPGITPITNGLWYGNDDFLICPSCFEEAIKGTSLASQLMYHNSKIPYEAAYCCMHSPRMRELWRDACERHDLTDFTAFAQHRHTIYQQTIPQMRQIVEITKLRMQTKQTLMISGIMLQGGDNLVSAARNPGTSHYTYGNSAIGYGFATSAGAHGAQQTNQASSMSIVDGDEMAQLAQLEAIWKQVE